MCERRLRREIGHLNGAARSGSPYDPRHASESPIRLVLAAEFPAASEDEWRALVGGGAAQVRPGAEPAPTRSRRCRAPRYDGITHPAAVHAPARTWPSRSTHVKDAWDVRAQHRDPDPARVRAAALDDLETGATSLWLALGDAGLPVAELAAVLDGVYVDLAPIALDAGRQTREAAAAFLDLLGATGSWPRTRSPARSAPTRSGCARAPAPMPTC